MPTTTVERRPAHEHTYHSALHVGQSAPQPADPVGGTAAGFRKTVHWNTLHGAHQHADRECARSADGVAGAGGGRSNIGGEEYNHRRRVGVHGGGCKSRAEWSAGDWIRVRETVSALLASVVSAGGLEHAQSGSQAVCVGSERCRKARKGARSQEIA